MRLASTPHTALPCGCTPPVNKLLINVCLVILRTLFSNYIPSKRGIHTGDKVSVIWRIITQCSDVVEEIVLQRVVIQPEKMASSPCATAQDQAWSVRSPNETLSCPVSSCLHIIIVFLCNDSVYYEV